MKKYNLFLDRDGVINYDVGYLSSISHINLAHDFLAWFSSVAHLIDQVFIVTNQSAVARGYLDFHQAHNINDRIIELLDKHGVEIQDSLICPHHENGVVPEYSVKCECRKPRPGMINILAERYKIDKRKSVFVGDKTTDVQAGDNAGLIKSFLISGACHTGGNVERFLEVTNFLKG